MSGTLPPLTSHTLLGSWQFAPVTDVIVLLAAGLYLSRAHLRRPADAQRWPVGRTVVFLGGLVVAAVTIQSSIDIYGRELFYLHMIEHLLLIMVVPGLVILGQPLRLLQEGADRLARRSRAVLDTRAVAIATFPLLGIALYAVVVVGTHLTGFFQSMLTDAWLHDLEIALYLVSGYLYFLPALGNEPLRRELSYPLRVFLLFLGMMVDTIVGVLLMLSAREPFPAYAAQHRTWGPALLDDIHTGGGIMWVVGDGLMFGIVVLVVSQWMADTERQNDTGKWLEAARRSALAGQGVDTVDPDDDADIDNDDAALAAYNRMLSRLSETPPHNRP
ncbi:MAG TPA: cytochrome c oxidase assembly protein [Pseudonocardiaceae bacterium]|nr:cytochrome c oxidase assembly protein [Pseudonocardiaceae bacterium]